MEAVELKFSEVLEDNETIRIDSGYFRKEVLIAYHNLKEKPYYLNKEISIIKSGTTPKDRDDELKEGVILLKTNDIRNNILLDEKEKFYYIDSNIDEKMKSTRLKSGDILINIVGATTDVIGRTSLIFDNFPKANITQAMAFCRIKQNILKQEYLFIFLQTYYGQIQVKRLARPTGQYNLNLEEVAKIIIPKLDDNFQLQIKNIVQSSYQKLEESKTLYKEAEELLLKELDLLNFKPSEVNIATKYFKESFGVTGRLDSEYYQPKYDDLIEKIKSYKGGWKFIREILSKDIKNGTTPKEVIQEYQPHKKYFFRAEAFNDDISLNEISLYSIEEETYKKYKNIQATTNDILVSMTGTIGKVAIITQNISGIINQNIVKLSANSKIINYKVLALYIKSIGRQLLQREQTGNVQPYVNIPNFSNMVVPVVDIVIQTKIEEKIKKSFELKEESKKLLDLAKKAVEVAIEKNEDEAIKIIDEASI